MKAFQWILMIITFLFVMFLSYQFQSAIEVMRESNLQIQREGR